MVRAKAAKREVAELKSFQLSSDLKTAIFQHIKNDVIRSDEFKAVRTQVLNYIESTSDSMRLKATSKDDITRSKEMAAIASFVRNELRKRLI